MSDIVERLRAAAKMPKSMVLVDVAFNEAADYIERLEDRVVSGRVVPLQSPSGGWRCIGTYSPATDSEFAIVAYENGHVTPAEYSEYHVGGPDDHQTWDPLIPDPAGKLVLRFEWPTHWMPMPAPPVAADTAAESKLASNERPDRHPSPTLRAWAKRFVDDADANNGCPPNAVAGDSLLDMCRALLASESLRAEMVEALRNLHDSYVKVCPFANLVAQHARAILTKADSESGEKTK